RATAITTADGESKPSAGGLLRGSGMLTPIMNYHRVVEVNPQPDSHRYELNLQLDSGSTLIGRFTGPDGQPLVDTGSIYYAGTLAAFPLSWVPARGGSFEVVGYEAAHPRRLVFYDSQRNLAGSLL